MIPTYGYLYTGFIFLTSALHVPKLSFVSALCQSFDDSMIEFGVGKPNFVFVISIMFVFTSFDNYTECSKLFTTERI